MLLCSDFVVAFASRSFDPKFQLLFVCAFVVFVGYG